MQVFSNYIEIDGAGFPKPVYYEQEVLRVLRQINDTDMGMLVLYELKKTGKTLKIKPTVKRTDILAKIISHRILDAEANPQNKHPWSSEGNKYCALPGDSPVEYLPGDYYPQTGTFIKIEPFFGPDDVLVHEIFHKIRMFNGTACKTPTNDPYENIEEFFAITITNIYLSSIGKNNRLRSGHSLFIEQLKMPSAQFADKYDERMSILRKEMDNFCGFVAGIECKFNPVRDAYNFIQQVKNSPSIKNPYLPSI